MMRQQRDDAASLPLPDAGKSYGLCHYLSLIRWLRCCMREVDLGGRRRRQHLEEVIQRQAAELKRMCVADQQRLQMLAMASHDLRNPVAAIQGFVELLREDTHNAISREQRELLNWIYERAEFMQVLLRDILDLAQLENNVIQLRYQPVHYVQFLQRLLATNQHTSLARHRTLVLQTTAQLPQLWADPLRLEQVVNNLLQNALAHAPVRSQVTVRVDLEPEGVRTSICDQGPGIAAHELPHIFKEFYKGAKPGGNGQSAGSGLGLAIARQLISLHGGSIGAASEPGVGTTIYFFLPAAAVCDAVETVAA